MTTRTSEAPESEQIAVKTVVPCLTFADRCEEAVNFYVSVIPNSRIVSMDRWGPDAPVAAGKIVNTTFVLNGREYRAFDGGEHFKFSDAFSFVAVCETQDQLDELWATLTADGGEPGPCGWLTDKFGVSWQVIPAALERMMSDPKSGSTGAVLDAVLKMGKLDINTLEAAYKKR